MQNVTQDSEEQPTNMTAFGWCDKWNKFIQSYDQIKAQIKPDPSEVIPNRSRTNRSPIETANIIVKCRKS